MTGGVLYLDASALVKLVVKEPGTDEMERSLGAGPDLASSIVAAVEVVRVARRAGGGTVETSARALLARLNLVDLDRTIVADAQHVVPASLGSLDAIHLASALSFGADVDALVTYDMRLADAARAAGVEVLSPGR